MSNENEITWVELKLEIPDDIAARLEIIARQAGLSFKCYCVRVLLKHVMEDASAEQKERIQKGMPATMRRNGCDDIAEL